MLFPAICSLFLQGGSKFEQKFQSARRDRICLFLWNFAPRITGTRQNLEGDSNTDELSASDP